LVTTTVAADSPAPVTAEPSRPASEPADERRLSSLRILRRRADDETAEPVVMPAAELDVIEPPGEEEAVRVLPAAVPDKAVVEDLFARIRAARAEAVEEARLVLAEPEPEPERATTNEDERALQRRDEAVADLEAKLARKLKRSLQDEQNDLLDRLRSVRGKPGPSVLPDPSEHAARHEAVALPFLAEAAAAASPGASPDLSAIAAELVDAIVSPLRRQLERLLAADADADDDQDTPAAERVGMAYREWKGDRVERLAGDAVAAAWSAGWFEAAPEGAVLRWVVDDQGGPCPDCDDNALAGPTPKGESYPTGQVRPPAHAGCRCLLIDVAQ
jgi:hypothetical protein